MNRAAKGNEGSLRSLLLIVGILVAVIGAITLFKQPTEAVLWFVVVFLIGLYFFFAVRIVAQWEKVVVLRFGRFRRLAEPGIILIVPYMDVVAYRVDQRVQVSPFQAEQTLSKDTVPVDVDAVMFWMVFDAEKAALEVTSYHEAVSWAAQTALRDLIGRTPLAELLSGRDVIDQTLRDTIDERTASWGISVRSVEIRDVTIPRGLQDAMSAEAQAERERRARVILGRAEEEVAHSFKEASEMYLDNPAALQLRAMNILYEGLKQGTHMVVVPSSVADSLGVGSLLGLANTAAGLLSQQARSDTQ
ncbi:MAG: slipin family protein [Firmicutes bacterium]|nr:slipin family protein [Bacillota bacterium]